MKIQGQAGEIQLAKRFYVPGIVIKDNCPHCGTESTYDLSTSYLSHPTANKPIDFIQCCNKCNREWLKFVTVKLTVEVAR